MNPVTEYITSMTSLFKILRRSKTKRTGFHSTENSRTELDQKYRTGKEIYDRRRMRETQNAILNRRNRDRSYSGERKRNLLHLGIRAQSVTEETDKETFYSEEVNPYIDKYPTLLQVGMSI